MAKSLFHEPVDPLADHRTELDRESMQLVGKRQEANSNATASAWHSTAFTLEVVVILLFVVISMAVLTAMFGKSYQIGQRADTVTHAITLATVGADNGAETFEANPSDPACPEQVMYTFNGASYKKTTAYVPGVYVVRRAVESDNTGGGTLYRATIEVSRYNETVYTLSCAKYVSNNRKGKAVKSHERKDQ